MLIAIIVVYLAAMLVVGAVFSSRIKRASDYLRQRASGVDGRLRRLRARKS